MRRLVRIPEDADIPMIGLINVGLIDRGTNLIQVRAISGCNLNCIFCSVDEGPLSKTRVTTYVVDIDTLMEWFNEIVEFKNTDKIEAHLDGTGEPTLHPKFVELVSRIAENERVKVISLQTNGVTLTYKLIDELEEIGMTRINLSLHSLDPEKSKLLVGSKNYKIDKILDTAEYIANSRIDLLIAPVWVPGINDDDIIDIIEYAKQTIKSSNWPILGIQKLEIHKYGRKPKNVRGMSWFKFYSRLRVWERKFKVKLKLSRSDFGIFPMKIVPPVFKKGEKVRVRIVAPGWMRSEMIGVAKDRAVTVINTNAQVGDLVNVRIVKTKHNIYIGVPA
ncbi:MAG: radical SAM protein [Candidatus Aenigmarchaeota archaeon]|nr:radical SAM protein [Candidatus Aenigmarchaeota archaeon]